MSSSNDENKNGSNHFQDSDFNKGKIIEDNKDTLIENIGALMTKIDKLITSIESSNKNMEAMNTNVNKAVTSMNSALESMNKNVTDISGQMNITVKAILELLTKVENKLNKENQSN